jgi:hypothetical protein
VSAGACIITEQLATTVEEPFARLVAFEPTTFPVLSVYLNTQSDQHGRTPDAAPYLHREFKALARTWAPSSPDRVLRRQRDVQFKSSSDQFLA